MRVIKRVPGVGDVSSSECLTLIPPPESDEREIIAGCRQVLPGLQRTQPAAPCGDDPGFDNGKVAFTAAAALFRQRIGGWGYCVAGSLR